MMMGDDDDRWWLIKMIDDDDDVGWWWWINEIITHKKSCEAWLFVSYYYNTYYWRNVSANLCADFCFDTHEYVCDYHEE